MLSVMKRITENIVEHDPFNEINDKIRTEARKKFESYCREGIILSEWDQPEWVISNQRQQYKVVFSRKEFQLRKVCKNYHRFMEDLKTFVMIRIGTSAMEHIRTMVNYIICETIKSNYYKKEERPSGKLHGFPLMYYVSWLEIQQPSDVDINYLKLCRQELTAVRNRNAEQKKQQHPAALCEFQAYFRFDWMLRDYWENIASEQERALYWPLYLFWVITTIIPMRVTEFCVTDLDCIKKENGKFYLTIRRSRMKGNGFKIYTYKIQGDYYPCTYEIPKWVFECIQGYKELTAAAPHPLGLLFSAGYLAMLEGREKRMKRPDRLFIDTDLSHLMDCFYKNVVEGHYKYQIVSEEDLVKRYVDTENSSMELQAEETMVIQLKHTRHLAMINLVMRGCNPIMIKEFAGHADAAISENYYGNISKVIRCASRTFYDRAKNGGNTAVVFGFETNAAAYLPVHMQNKVTVDYGECGSEKFASGQSEDCIRAGGNCLRCIFLRRKEMLEEEINIQEQVVDTETQYVMELLKDPKLEQKIQEYQQEMLAAQRDMALLYRQYSALWEVRDAKEEEISTV